MKIPSHITRLALPASLAAILVLTGCAGGATTEDSATSASETATEEVLEETAKASDGTSVTDYAYDVDLGTSELYDTDARQAAVDTIMTEFNRWEGCRMLRIRYTDDKTSQDALSYCNELRKDGEEAFSEAIVFKSDFHSPSKELSEGTAWEPDTDYTDYVWYLARTADGFWQICTFGYA